MKFGVTMFQADFAMNPVALARAVEERGFESLFFPEHTHIPVSFSSVSPTGRPIKDEYWHTIDPFATIAAAAAVTRRLNFATGVCLVVERDPIILAKEVASVDFLSKGRFLFGIGGGWNEEEMSNHGTNPRRRFRLLREQIAAMKAIWTQDEAEYHGEFIDFEPMWSWPKPVQKPHPPILVGGGGPRALERVIEYGDGWLPSGFHFTAERARELQQRAAAAGRGSIPITVFRATPTEEAIEQYAEAGVERCVLPLPPGPESEVMPVLEQRTRLVGRVGVA